jgi:hypothetical protein
MVFPILARPLMLVEFVVGITPLVLDVMEFLILKPSWIVVEFVVEMVALALVKFFVVKELIVKLAIKQLAILVLEIVFGVIIPILAWIQLTPPIAPFYRILAPPIIQAMELNNSLPMKPPHQPVVQ